VPELFFEGTGAWSGATECTISAKGKQIEAVSPPSSFGGKESYATPEDVFAAALASCINTLFLIIAKNS
jgi:organic hydroperoxide reductase OsmC/OhrA